MLREAFLSFLWCRPFYGVGDDSQVEKEESHRCSPSPEFSTACGNIRHSSELWTSSISCMQQLGPSGFVSGALVIRTSVPQLWH